MPITKVKVNGPWELASPSSGGGTVDSVNGQTGTVVLTASDVGALPDSTTIPQGTVTSVRVQATSPVASSVNTAQSSSLNTTISLSSAYGDTQNPYGSKTKNYVLAAPSNANGNPSFRALVAGDIPDLSGTYLTSAPVTSVNSKTGAVSLTASDVGALPSSTTIPQGTVTSVRVQATSPVQSSTSTAQSTSLNTTISLASGYGDTQNPYGTKTANYVLAGPTTGINTAPTFRKLVAADIPDLSGTYLTSAPVTSVNSKTGAVSLSASDVSALPLSAGSGNALTGDLYFSSGTQQIGGHATNTETVPSAISVTANTAINVLSVTNLESTGVYMLVGQIFFTPGASTSAFIRSCIHTTSSTAIEGEFQQDSYSNSTSTRHINISGVVTGQTAYYLNIRSAVAGTVTTSSTFSYIRIA